MWLQLLWQTQFVRTNAAWAAARCRRLQRLERMSQAQSPGARRLPRWDRSLLCPWRSSHSTFIVRRTCRSDASAFGVWKRCLWSQSGWLSSRSSRAAAGRAPPTPSTTFLRTTSKPAKLPGDNRW